MTKMNKFIRCELCGENIYPDMYMRHLRELCPKTHQMEICPYCQTMVATQWLDDHLQNKCSFQFIKSVEKRIVTPISGLVQFIKSVEKPIVTPISGLVQCPRCSSETKLLWLSKATPLCINCIANISGKKVLFLPTIVQSINDRWIVISRIKMVDYTRQLLYYIDECITLIEQKRANNKHTTRDKKTLLELIDMLLSEYVLHPISRKKNLRSVQLQLQLLAEQKANVENLRNRIKTFSNERMNEINIPRARSEDKKEETIIVKELSWQILPPGKHPFLRIIAHYKQISLSNSIVNFDENRLYEINSLGPSAIYKGQGDFSDYIAFEFQSKQVAVLENPVFGNAIYVIRGDWRKLSKLSKSELLWNHSNNTTRIIHRGDWLVRLKRELHF